jgi:ABC-type Zn uptake system ZnuABC Zn-binding protein ZnuA
MIMILILVMGIGLRIGPVAAAALALAVLAACGSSGDDGDTTIAATTGITADIAENIAGPGIEVGQIVPDGASPHDFELSAQDRQRLEEADLIVANGSGLEAGIPLDDIDAPIWELTDHAGEPRALEEIEGEEHADEHAEEGGEHAGDPHVWMDPVRVAEALPSVTEAIGEVDPDGAAGYRERARRYARRLRSLNREMAKQLEAVPADDRELVTSHDSLGYLADRYGFDVVATAFPATGPEAETTAARLQEVEDAVRSSDVPAVFAQESDDPEALQLVAQQTGVEVEYGLLVESPAAAGSYEEMLRQDAELIANSLRARR